MKIAVFCGLFAAEQKDNNSKHILQLNYNGVRLASHSAKLGYINPSALQRGVSIASTVESGGPIYCLRCKILDLSVVMSKIKRSVEPTNISLTSPGGSKNWELNTVLNVFESTEFRKILEKLKQKTIDSLEGSSDLSLASLLDSYGCDESIIRDFQV